eukprot:jgi/Botrbrau1/17586/Bobra.0166s0028.1
MGSSGTRDLSPVQGDTAQDLESSQFKTIPSTSSSIEDQKSSASGFEALLPESAEGQKYSVTFDEAPTLSEDVIGFLKNTKRSAQAEYSQYRWYDWISLFLPIFRWLPTYDWRRNLLTDVIAGLSVGAMVVPQGMSYANLAGLPSVYGLYGAFVPVLVYSVLGSSRQLAVGPVAVTSLLLGSGLEDTVDVPIQTNPNNPANPQAQQEYNEAAIQVALLAGAIYTAVGSVSAGLAD